MIRSLISVARTAVDRTALLSSSQCFRPSPQLALAGVGGVDIDPSAFAPPSSTGTSNGGGAGLFDALWLAVPKSRKTRGKKRMKTTNQKRIAKKANIITDARTGETTLMHKLPFNWREYLPNV
jgi:ribosomal protein L32